MQSQEINKHTRKSKKKVVQKDEEMFETNVFVRTETMRDQDWHLLASVEELELVLHQA